MTLDGFETYQGSINSFTNSNGTFSSVSSGWPNAVEEEATLLNVGATFGCAVTIDTATNEFSCTLSMQGGSPSGTFKGKFFGPNGDEIAGTFALTGVIRFSFDDGMSGAVVVKRVVPQ